MADAARDEHWMRAAIRLGKRGLGNTWPNPSVGCVLVQNGLVVGRGQTQKDGRPHAEVVALEQAGHRAKGATAYVSLEPCSHHGQTPPCAQSLIDAGISHVVIGANDPDPRVNGRGIAMLRDAGIDVTIGVCANEAEAANIGFLTRVRENRPYLTLKLATTADGKIATNSGESKWITGPQARRDVHLNRSFNDAIMVGRGTVAADDPMLDVRDMGPIRSPLRVVLDSNLSIRKNARIFNITPRNLTWVVCSQSLASDLKQGFLDAGIDVLAAPDDVSEGLDLKTIMEMLASKGVTRIYCEGGARLAASLIQKDLVDELHIYQAGRLFGANALPSVAPLEFSKLSTSPKFRLRDCTPLGGDTRSIWMKA